MPNPILRAFLERQWRAGRKLVDESDVLELAAVDGDPPQAYLVHLGCRTLIRAPGGAIVQTEGCVVGLRFPDDYLRTAHAAAVLTWLAPPEIWHPNIRPPFICVGNITPGTPLVELLYRVHEIVTWNKVTMHEGDAMNWPACAWARQNPQRFPVDARPLKRRLRDFDVELPTGHMEARP